MADAQIIAIAEGVKALLNAHAFSQGFTAERAYMPVVELKDLKVLKVWVVPKAKETAVLSRTSNENIFSIDVAVQKQARTVAECDPLMLLAEEIGDYLDRRPLPGVDGLSWIGDANAPIWDPADLHERHTFTTVVTVQYRGTSAA